jgi:hypothetical protein
VTNWILYQLSNQIFEEYGDEVGFNQSSCLHFLYFLGNYNNYLKFQFGLLMFCIFGGVGGYLLSFVFDTSSAGYIPTTCTVVKKTASGTTAFTYVFNYPTNTVNKNYTTTLQKNLESYNLGEQIRC